MFSNLARIEADRAFKEAYYEYDKKNLKEESIEHYQKAINLSPQTNQYRLYLSRVYFELIDDIDDVDNEQSRNYLEECIETLEEGNGWGLETASYEYSLGYSYFLKKEYEESVEILSAEHLSNAHKWHPTKY